MAAGASYRRLVALEELLLLGLLDVGLAGEVLVGELVELESGDVDLSGGGNDVAGVDATEGDAVDLEGTGDEDDTVAQGLKVHDTLATETTSENNQDSTGLEGRAEGRRPDGLADLSIAQVSMVLSSSNRAVKSGLRWKWTRVL